MPSPPLSTASPPVEKSKLEKSKIEFHTFPAVLEQLARPFTFYLNGQLHQGIQYVDELHGLIQQLNLPNRCAAYPKRERFS